jgi:TRAP-type C4-dicarboxylate transport system permease small subunit
MKSLGKRILEVVAAASMFAIWFLTLLQVLSRYVFASPFGASLELISFTFIISIYIGSALVHMDAEGHMGFDSLYKKFKGKTLFVVNLIREISIIAFLIVLLVSGIAAVQSGWSSKLPLSGISVAWKYMLVPVASAVMLLTSIYHIIGFIKARRKKSGRGQSDDV